MTSNQIAFQRMVEERRSNLANEDLKQLGLNESIRSNQARENISWYEALERARSNKINEGISRGTLENKKATTFWDMAGDLATGIAKFLF